MAGHQQITHEWWETRRKDFDLYVSRAVVQAASLGETAMAGKRLEAIQNVHPEVDDLAEFFIKRGTLPPKALVDALHIAMAAVHKIDYLLTWNCKHIANAEIYQKVVRRCREKGYEPPIICTPEELQGE